jgi:Fe-S cluster biosynthesis and repair protein YggX
MGEGGGEATGSQAATAAAQFSQIQTLLLSINRLKKRQAENQQQLQQHMSELCSYTATQFKQDNTNMNRFAASPSRRLGGKRPGVSDASICHTLENTYDSTAKLSYFPRNLLLLWQEYLYELECNKAAKNFTSVERGRVKFKFCRRKCFWEVMVKLCNAGSTDLSSIDKVNQAYSMKHSVSTILDMMMRDRKVGGHPNLSL